MLFFNFSRTYLGLRFSFVCDCFIDCCLHFLFESTLVIRFSLLWVCVCVDSRSYRKCEVTQVDDDPSTRFLPLSRVTTYFSVQYLLLPIITKFKNYLKFVISKRNELIAHDLLSSYVSDRTLKAGQNKSYQ